MRFVCFLAPRICYWYMFSLPVAHTVVNDYHYLMWSWLLEVVALRFNVWVCQCYVLMAEPFLLIANRFFYLNKAIINSEYTKSSGYSSCSNIGLMIWCIYELNISEDNGFKLSQMNPYINIVEWDLNPLYGPKIVGRPLNCVSHYVGTTRPNSGPHRGAVGSYPST